MDEPFIDPARSRDAARSADPALAADAARMDALLAGIVAESGAAADAEDDVEIFELERSGRAGWRLLDRLRGAASARVEIAAGELVSGQVVAVGRDVLVLAGDEGDWAIPVWGLVAVVGLGEGVIPPGSVVDQLGLMSVVRTWSRERDVVRVHRVGAGPLDGTIDAVGADHLDLAEHDPGEPRRAEAVRRMVTVPLGAIAAIRRR